MRFMGDYPLAKNQKDIDCIYFLLQALHHHNELCNEVYCQVMKQTTNNKSTKVNTRVTFSTTKKDLRLNSFVFLFFTKF
jgi:hypothetical protein